MKQTNLDSYGQEPIPWSRALEALEADAGTYWLATVRPDGRPHVAGLGAVWVDGKYYFVSGDGTPHTPSRVVEVTDPPRPIGGSLRIRHGPAPLDSLFIPALCMVAR